MGSDKGGNMGAGCLERTLTHTGGSCGFVGVYSRACACTGVQNMSMLIAGG